MVRRPGPDMVQRYEMSTNHVSAIVDLHESVVDVDVQKHGVEDAKLDLPVSHVTLKRIDVFDDFEGL